MTQLNGKRAPDAPPDPRLPIAEAVYTVMTDEGDPSFADLNDEDRDDLLTLTGNYIAAHVNFLKINGYRLIPPGVTPIPTSPEEALAMVQAASRFLEAQKRKPKLLGSGKRKLILPPGLPPGSKLQ